MRRKNKAEVAGKHNRKGATPGALSVRQQQKVEPEQIEGSREVAKKAALANSPTGAAPAAPSMGGEEEGAAIM